MPLNPNHPSIHPSYVTQMQFLANPVLYYNFDGSFLKGTQTSDGTDGAMLSVLLYQEYGAWNDHIHTAGSWSVSIGQCVAVSRFLSWLCHLLAVFRHCWMSVFPAEGMSNATNTPVVCIGFTGLLCTEKCQFERVICAYLMNVQSKIFVSSCRDWCGREQG